jgi:hypothetical protein
MVANGPWLVGTSYVGLNLLEAWVYGPAMLKSPKCQYLVEMAKHPTYLWAQLWRQEVYPPHYREAI